jgi:hypothetical protein
MQGPNRVIVSHPSKEAGRLVVAHKVAPKPSTLVTERLKIMTTHGSASLREETPHVNETTQITISDALRRRAQAVINDTSIEARWRDIVSYALEINDPLLPDLVRRALARESIIDTVHFSETPEVNEDHSSREKIEALVEIICGAGDEPAAALFVLMGTLQNSAEPEALANTAKHFAFTQCGERNVYSMVDAHIAVVEGELFAGDKLISHQRR